MICTERIEIVTRGALAILLLFACLGQSCAPAGFPQSESLDSVGTTSTVPPANSDPAAPAANTAEAVPNMPDPPTTVPPPGYYVAPDGNDSNPGTYAQPWLTLAKALGSVKPGDTVWARAGTYNEGLAPAVSGTSAAPISFRAYPGEAPAITGGVDFSSVDYVGIQGFDITNTAPDAPGIRVQSYYAETIRTGLLISKNHIHDCQGPDFGRGIDAYGVQNSLIELNEINDNYNTGIFLGGEMYAGVNNFNVVMRGNYIHYNGQDGIHPEGRSLVIEGNRIGNQFHTTAHQDGIEVYGPIDGLFIRNNLIWDTTQNIYLSAENYYIRNVTVIGNVVWRQRYTGESISGMNVGPNVADITNLRVEGNTFANCRVLFTDDYAKSSSYDITGLSINGNIFYNTPLSVNVANDYASDYNLFYSSTGDILAIGGSWYGDLTSFRSALPGKQGHSIQADPVFVDPANYNLHLAAGSPAVDAGIAIDGLTADPDGVQRPRGGAFDIGAYEYTGP